MPVFCRDGWMGTLDHQVLPVSTDQDLSDVDQGRIQVIQHIKVKLAGSDRKVTGLLCGGLPAPSVMLYECSAGTA